MTYRHYLSRVQSGRYAMEEVTLTQEQLEALTEGGHFYAYLTGGGGDEGEGAVVVGASADELGVVGEPQQILLNQAAEGQEVFVLDQETGEYQRCIYVKPTEQVDEEPFQPAVVVGGGDGNDSSAAGKCILVIVSYVDFL